MSAPFSVRFDPVTRRLLKQLARLQAISQGGVLRALVHAAADKAQIAEAGNGQS